MYVCVHVCGSHPPPTATDNGTVIPGSLTDFCQLLGPREQPEKCRLGLQLIQETAQLLASHYLDKRTSTGGLTMLLLSSEVHAHTHTHTHTQTHTPHTHAHTHAHAHTHTHTHTHTQQSVYSLIDFEYISTHTHTHTHAHTHTHTHTEQSVYSLIDFEYVSFLGRFLGQLCRAMIAKWEEAVSMNTASLKDGNLG